MALKILQITNSLATGGAEKLLLETIPFYREKGIDMDLLVINGTNYPFMKQLKKQNCCAIYSLSIQSVYNPLAIFKMIPYLQKYDIIHVHLFPAQYWVIMAKIISFSKVNVIYTEHSTANRRRKNILFKFLDQIVYSCFDKVICITNEVKVNLQKHIRFVSNKLVVIENGVNIAAIKSAQAYFKNEIHSEIGQEEIVIIQVSGFREAKDQFTLIKAMSLLPNNYKLVLVGEGILQSQCEDLSKELQLQNRVFFLGVRMDVARLLKTAEISVLSSHWEGFGLVAVEGMASGKPFIASNVPGLSEIVKDAGILFEQGNAIELAAAIEKLIIDPDYYQFVIKACQERANLYDIKLMVDKHIQLYEDID